MSGGQAILPSNKFILVREVACVCKGRLVEVRKSGDRLLRRSLIVDLNCLLNGNLTERPEVIFGLLGLASTAYFSWLCEAILLRRLPTAEKVTMRLGRQDLDLGRRTFDLTDNASLFGCFFLLRQLLRLPLGLLAA